MISTQTIPNILLIMMDATRADRLSCYGYERSTTPHLDKIASEGVLYDQAFAPDVWTLPVVSSVFTGLMPHEHRVTFQNPYLAPHYVTLAELLAEHGYVTWGMSSGSWIGPATGSDKGFSEFWESYRLLKGYTTSKAIELINRFYAKYIHRRYDKGARQINHDVVKWLQTRQTGNSDVPFFMFLHYLEPHYPYRPPRPFDALYLTDRRLLAKARRINHNPLDFFAGRISLKEEDFELLNRLYDAEISYMDTQLGYLFKVLEEFNLLETTAVILFADHGENIGDHGLLDHHFCLYDSLIRVPLIIHYPPLFPQGKRIRDLVQVQDIFNTVLKMAGLGNGLIPANTHSLCIKDVEENPRDYIIAGTSGDFLKSIEKRRPLRDISCFDRELKAVRTSHYKYIEGSDGSAEFYNLQNDPNEQHNLVNERPNELFELQTILQQEFPEHVNGPNTEGSGFVVDDPVVVERLRSLGYID